MNKEFIIGLLSGFALAFIIFIIFLIQNSHPCVVEGLEGLKNKACREYITIQNPPCSDWTKINVILWTGESVKFNEFFNEFYGCETEDCARKICFCSGY